MKKLAWMIFLAAAVVSSARTAGWPAGTTVGTGFASAEPSSEEQVLRVMVFDPTSMKEAWDQLIELAREFEDDNPGVRVKLLSEGGGGDVLTKLKIMLAARQPLDVVAIDVLEFSTFLADGVLLDLQPYFDRDATWDPAAYYQIVLDAFRGPNGHLYGLPSTFTPYVMYYNMDILDRAGISYPTAGWTWQDLLAIARACTQRTDRGRQWGISITQWPQALAPWIWQNGGRFFNDDLTRCTLDEPEAVEAIEFLARLFHVEQIAATDATMEGQLTRGEFQAGNVALYGPVGYWEVYRFKEIRDFKWDVCPLPRGKEAATSIALRSYVGLRHSEYPELTYKFIRMLAEEKMSRTLAQIGNGVPGLKKVARSESFLKPDVAPRSEQVFLDAIEHARFLPVFANWREIRHLLQAELQDCLIFGKTDAKTACAQSAVKINEFLRRESYERNRPPAPVWLLATITAAVGLGLLAAFWICRGQPPHRLGRSEERAGYRFIGLWASGFVLFTMGPMLASLALSLTAWSSIRPISEARWVGLDNYYRMFADASFWKSVWVTVEYVAFSVPLSLTLALSLALLVRRGHAVFRTVYYMPTIVSLVALGVIWRWILGSDWITAVLGARWIESEHWIVPGFVLMSVWGVGVPMMIFLAGLQGIDSALYEAARLDGAPRWRLFAHITLPQLAPVLLFNLVMGVIGAFQVFAQPYVMTGGGPGNASLFYVLYLFKTAFRFQHMGYACALGWVLFLTLLGLTLLLLRQAKSWVHYEGATV